MRTFMNSTQASYRVLKGGLASAYSIRSYGLQAKSSPNLLDKRRRCPSEWSLQIDDNCPVRTASGIRKIWSGIPTIMPDRFSRLAGFGFFPTIGIDDFVLRIIQKYDDLIVRPGVRWALSSFFK